MLRDAEVLHVERERILPRCGRAVRGPRAIYVAEEFGNAHGDVGGAHNGKLRRLQLRCDLRRKLRAIAAGAGRQPALHGLDAFELAGGAHLDVHFAPLTRKLLPQRPVADGRERFGAHGTAQQHRSLRHEVLAEEGPRRHLTRGHVRENAAVSGRRAPVERRRRARCQHLSRRREAARRRAEEAAAPINPRDERGEAGVAAGVRLRRGRRISLRARPTRQRRGHEAGQVLLDPAVMRERGCLARIPIAIAVHLVQLERAALQLRRKGSPQPRQR
mmetsp:Transcript_37879/g.118698  ORF Transcript_37879/g.118698 Transcript_37879/m.118698 type:complete len:274 (+) Transcript_37879:1136-1957(+)